METEGLTEEELERQKNSTLSQDFKRYISEMGEAFRMPAFRKLLFYIVIGGLIVPRFSTFSYYFTMDVIGLSKFSYSMLSVLAFFCAMIGATIYKKYFRENEYRNMIMMEALIHIFTAPLSFMVTTRINLDYGIPDIYLIVFNEIIDDIVA